MQEIIIRYNDPKILLLLKDFAKHFDFVIEERKQKKQPKTLAKKSNDLTIEGLPIVFADSPDVASLAGIWKGKNISLKTLREKAWGNRL